MTWNEVLPGLWRYVDSCNVYAVMAPDGMLIIDAGTGRWLDHVDQLPAQPAALLLTHYYRDHSAGALCAARAGIPVYAGEHDRGKYINPAQHFRAPNLCRVRMRPSGATLCE